LIHFVPPESVVPPAVNVIVSPRHAGSALVVIVPPLSAPLSTQASQACSQHVPSEQQLLQHPPVVGSQQVQHAKPQHSVPQGQQFEPQQS